MRRYLNDAARWRSKHEERIYNMEENRLERAFNATIKAAKQLHDKKRKTKQATDSTAVTLRSKKTKPAITIDLTGDD